MEQSRPLALKVLIALLLVEGVIGWVVFAGGWGHGEWRPLHPGLVLPFAAWGLYRLVPSWRVLSLVYLVLCFLMLLVSVGLQLGSELGGQERLRSWISFPEFATGQPALQWILILAVGALLAWGIRVLLRRDIVALFNARSASRPQISR